MNRTRPPTRASRRRSRISNTGIVTSTVVVGALLLCCGLGALLRSGVPRTGGSGEVCAIGGWRHGLCALVGRHDAGAERLDIRPHAHAGALRWQIPLEDEIVSELAVGNGVHYASSTYALLVFDATIGAARWRFATDQADVGSPVVSDDAVYVTSYNIIFALNA